MFDRKVILTQAIENGFIKTVEGYPTTLKYCKEKNVYDYTIYGNTVDGNHTGDKTKNLIPFPYASTTSTVNGVNFRVIDDGRILANGTATDDISFYLLTENISEIIEPGKTYTISDGVRNNNYYLRLMINDSFHAWNSSPTFAAPSEITNLSIELHIQAGANLKNVMFKPQLERKSYYTSFEPYGYKMPISVMGKNLVDQESLLPAQGWIKQEDGSFYVSTGRTVYRKRLWENTEGYTGILYINFRIKFLKGSDESVSGVNIRTIYTDGTEEVVLLLANKWNANQWNVPDYHVYTNGNKIVDHLEWGYGTGGNSTWVKDIVISKTFKTYDLFLSKQLNKDESLNLTTDNLPLLHLGEESNNIVVDTSISPSNISVTYNTKVRGSHE